MTDVATTLYRFSKSKALTPHEQDLTLKIATTFDVPDELSLVASARTLAEVLLAAILSSVHRHPNPQKAKDLGQDVGLCALSALANLKETSS